MTTTIQVKIDFIAKLPDSYKLVLVEMGPWPEQEIEQNLRRLGQRVCDCITAVINGRVTERYPEVVGRPIWIQVDAYDTPRWEIEALLARLQNMVNTSSEIQKELKNGRFTSSILISHRWVDFSAEYAKREAKKKHSFWQRLKIIRRQK